MPSVWSPGCPGDVGIKWGWSVGGLGGISAEWRCHILKTGNWRRKHVFVCLCVCVSAETLVVDCVHYCEFLTLRHRHTHMLESEARAVDIGEQKKTKKTRLFFVLYCCHSNGRALRCSKSLCKDWQISSKMEGKDMQMTASLTVASILEIKTAQSLSITGNILNNYNSTFFMECLLFIMHPSVFFQHSLSVYIISLPTLINLYHHSIPIFLDHCTLL